MRVIDHHKHAQGLLRDLKIYREYVADIEASAPVKTPGIKEGLQAIEKAEAFIKSLDDETEKAARKVDMDIARAAELDDDL